MRFLQYKEESLDAVKVFADETRAQFQEVNSTVEEVRSIVISDLLAAMETLGRGGRHCHVVAQFKDHWPYGHGRSSDLLGSYRRGVKVC
jgi:hypothetical protein